MSNQSLIVRNDTHLSVEISLDGYALRDEALAAASMVPKAITDGKQQDYAVRIQAQIHGLIGAAEKTRKEIKAPILDYGRKIDAANQLFVEDVPEGCEESLRTALTRISQSLADFQAAEQARIKAAQALQSAELNDIERRRMEERSKAENVDQMELIDQRANEEIQAATQSLPVAAPLAPGQQIKDDWEVVIDDIKALALAHWDCVKCEPRLREIKALLDAGKTLPGVTAKRIIKSQVRVSDAMLKAREVKS